MKVDVTEIRKTHPSFLAWLHNIGMLVEKDDGMLIKIRESFPEDVGDGDGLVISTGGFWDIRR